MHVNIIPMGEVVDDLLVADSIGSFEIFQSLVGEDYAPSKCAVWHIAFEDGYAMLRTRLLHQQRKIETPGASTDHGDSQRSAISS